MAPGTLSYVLPLKAAEPPAVEFFEYVNFLSTLAEVLLVDASAPQVYDAVDELCSGEVRHLRPDADLMSLRNGKVRGVLTGLRRASFDFIVIADDDVRYTPAALSSVVDELRTADVVRPQNYFEPLPWHARLDTARMLINRMTGGDWPGTLALRRSALGPAGSYDGNVLFENLELVRTVKAAGGLESCRPDLYVLRRPPTTRHFVMQRVRQAYDEFARPYRLLAALSVIPLLGTLLATGRFRTAVVLFGAVPMLVAEAGRRRYGGQRVFPLSAVFWAPVWVAERGACAWIALGARLVLGGVPYAGRTLTVAANSEATIAKRFSDRHLTWVGRL
jgi:hypothetical protein